MPMSRIEVTEYSFWTLFLTYDIYQFEHTLLIRRYNFAPHSLILPQNKDTKRHMLCLRLQMQ
jgi:hypothetical protein